MPSTSCRAPSKMYRPLCITNAWNPSPASATSSCLHRYTKPNLPQGRTPQRIQGCSPRDLPPHASTAPSAYACPTSKGEYTSCTTCHPTKDSHREPIHPRTPSSPPHALTHHPPHAATSPTNAGPAHCSPQQGTHNRHQLHGFSSTR